MELNHPYQPNAKWLQKFRDEPSTLLDAIDEWQYCAPEMYYAIEAGLKPTMPSGYSELTDLLVLWADSERLAVNVGMLARYVRQIKARNARVLCHHCGGLGTDGCEQCGAEDVRDAYWEPTERIEAVLWETRPVIDRLWNLAKTWGHASERTQTPPAGEEPLTELQQSVYALIQERGPIYGKSICKELGIEYPTFRSHIISVLKKRRAVKNKRGAGYYAEQPPT